MRRNGQVQLLLWLLREFIKLVADPLLFERFDEIAFNAGMLDKSVILKTADYLRIAQPELVNFRRTA